MERIHVRRLTSAIALGMLALLIMVAPVGAGVSWCRADPIVKLNGSIVQIWVAVPDQYAPLVNGPVHVEIATPKNVTRELIMTDAGFNGHGETVAFTNRPGSSRDGDFRADIKVTVPINKALLPVGVTVPVQIEVITADGVSEFYYGTHLLTSASVRLQNVN